MKRAQTAVERFAASSPRRARLLRHEELILEVTELLSSALEDHQITKSELAEKLGKTKGFVTQVLSGNRNLTLRTIADIAEVLGFRIRVYREPVRQSGHSTPRASRRREQRKLPVAQFG